MVGTDDSTALFCFSVAKLCNSKICFWHQFLFSVRKKYLDCFDLKAFFFFFFRLNSDKWKSWKINSDINNGSSSHWESNPTVRLTCNNNDNNNTNSNNNNDNNNNKGNNDNNSIRNNNSNDLPVILKIGSQLRRSTYTGTFNLSWSFDGTQSCTRVVPKQTIWSTTS